MLSMLLVYLTKHLDNMSFRGAKRRRNLISILWISLNHITNQVVTKFQCRGSLLTSPVRKVNLPPATLLFLLTTKTQIE